MKTVPLTEAKAKLAQLVRELADYEQISLTRNGRVAGVLVHPEEWEALLETLEILSDPALMRQIRSSQRSRKTYTLQEVFGGRGS